ncbi:MAG: DUF262 domain-containing protein [candidate division Zixibacteria bacterium]|nr:DUF262 domain-containing protein [candidate division Zixibacteria bacterium]MBU1469532.1 DUF262 domain-containing protein [candidate division Zixibacteria bacterium]MBU2624566.1 DUF262 domain-containing protein [candidate division Zixibacteria bacterium]
MKNDFELEDEEIEDELGDESEVLLFKYAITSYGADYPIDGLVKRIANESILVPTFQRGFVWNINQASRFVESLLLGLPVPGIFLSKEKETQHLLVIDGQQRLRTLQYFYEGIFAHTGREFELTNVQKQLRGMTYKKLKDEDRRRLDDSILHATIVKQDEPSEDDSSIYHIFERLNTGGTHLHPQEIRACMYHGEFNRLLDELNQNKFWRLVYGNVSSRMRDQELILRFFAMLFDIENYSRPMKDFLNSYMAKNKSLKLQSAEKLTEVFSNTVQLVNESIGDRAFKPLRALNAAVFDAIMTGIARRLEAGNIEDMDAVRESYEALLNDRDFLGATHTGTADETIVYKRISLATTAFENVR